MAAVVASILFGSHAISIGAQTKRAAPLRTSEELTARLRELQPEIEAILGWPLGDDPEALVVSNAEMSRVVLEEAVIRSAWRLPKLKASTLRKGEEIKTAALAGALLGKVELARNRVLINLDVIKSISYLGDRDLIWTQDFVDVILAHEATHVAQNRRYSLAATFFGTPLTELVGFQAITEGQAQYVAREFAVKRGLLDVHRAYTGIHTGEHVDAPPLLKPLLQVLVQASAFAYLQGEEFYRAVVAKWGETEGPIRLYEHALPIMDQVTHPEHYFSAELAPKPVPTPRPTRTLEVELWHDSDNPVESGGELHLWANGPNFEVTVARGEEGAVFADVPESAELRCGAVTVAGVPWDAVLGEPVKRFDGGIYRVFVGGKPHATACLRDAITGELVLGAKLLRFPPEFRLWSQSLDEAEDWGTLEDWGTTDAIGLGRSEDEPPEPEDWLITHPDYAPEVRIGGEHSEVRTVVPLNRGGRMFVDWDHDGSGALQWLLVERAPFQFETVVPFPMDRATIRAASLREDFDSGPQLPGFYVVRGLYRESPFSEPVERTVQVRPWQSTYLSFPKSPPRPAQSLQLSIEVPAAWPIPSTQVLRAESAALGGGHWQLTNLPAPQAQGEDRVYRLTIPYGEGDRLHIAILPAGYLAEVMVKEGAEEATVRLPPPLRLRVEVVRADGSKILQPVRVGVHRCQEDDEPLAYEWTDAHKMQVAEWADPQGLEVLRAPGRYLVTAEQEYIGKAEAITELGPMESGSGGGKQTLRLRLSP